MSVLAIPSFEAMFSSGGDDRSFRLIQGALIRAQELAVLQKKEQVILFDLDAPSVTLESKIALPPKTKIRITMPDDGRQITSGETAITVDRYGNLEPFKISLGATDATANPFTGLLETGDRPPE